MTFMVTSYQREICEKYFFKAQEALAIVDKDLKFVKMNGI